VTNTDDGPFDSAAPLTEPAEQRLRAMTGLLRRWRAKTIQKVTADLEGFQFNTMVAALIEYVNELMRMRNSEVVHTPDWREAIETLVLLMAPSTPFVAEELWEHLGNPYSVHQQAWPTYDEALTHDDAFVVAVQVNGKVRDRVVIPSGSSEELVKNHVLRQPKIAEALNGRELRKFIYVPGRLVNIVV
jgi:leucyl-tRNA synthetase